VNLLFKTRATWKGREGERTVLSEGAGVARSSNGNDNQYQQHSDVVEQRAGFATETEAVRVQHELFPSACSSINKR
jgi:hypothetical protein